MKKRFYSLSLLTLFSVLINCNSSVIKAEDPLIYVDPFIGTGFHGHTFPGATLPFGMVQLSPDTHLDGWDASSGYHYDDHQIYGFSHSHLSGTGIGDLGDVAFLPYDYLRSLDSVNWFLSNIVTWILFAVGSVAFIYWMAQLYKSNAAGEEDRTSTSHSYLG